MSVNFVKGVLILAVAAIFLASPLRAEPDPAATDPVTTIEKLHNKLISVMQQAKELGYMGRRDTLTPIILASFDLRKMTRVTAGHYWKEMGDAQREELTQAFTDMTLSNYALRFDGFSGEFFETLGTLQTPRDDTVVQTHIVTSDEKIRIDYLLRKSGEKWLIIDVFLKGTISELAARRSEYMSVIRDRGVDALIKAVEKKALNLAESG